ncbi:hypothetical protein HAX54_040505, partial [Datura stramonium]|nr:hypothetical protein [Datura stramonium]
VATVLYWRNTSVQEQVIPLEKFLMRKVEVGLKEREPTFHQRNAGSISRYVGLPRATSPNPHFTCASRVEICEMPVWHQNNEIYLVFCQESASQQSLAGLHRHLT